MKRLISIDIAKAICIILVVVGHYHPDNAPEWYGIIIRFIYTFHMPLFIFASGYIYAATNRGGEITTFLYKKFRRLLLPYFTTSILIISLKLLSQRDLPLDNPVTLLSYLKMFYQPEAGFFLWFIWALWLIFLLITLFRNQTNRTILFGISLLIGFIPLKWPEIFCIPQAINMLKYFMLGVFLADHRYWIEKAKNVPTLYPILALPLLFLMEFFVPNKIYLQTIRIVLPFVGIYSVCSLSIWIKRNWNSLTQKLLVVSASSYIIYLFHTTFEGFMKTALRKIPILGNGDDSILFSIKALLIIVTGIVFPILLHRFVLSRNNIFRFLFGLKPAKQLP